MSEKGQRNQLHLLARAAVLRVHHPLRAEVLAKEGKDHLRARLLQSVHIKVSRRISTIKTKITNTREETRQGYACENMF